MNRYLLVLFCMGLFSSPALAAGLDKHQLVSGRTFLVHDQKNEASESRPLLIALHGGAGNGRSMARLTSLNEKADQNGFIVIYPNGSGRIDRFASWNAGECCGYAVKKSMDDVAFIDDIITYAIKNLHADAKRIYLTGISNGAMMAFRIAAEIPERIAAIATVAGTMVISPGNIKAAVPLIHFHGTDDTYVPYQGGTGKHTVSGMDYMPVEQTIQTWLQAHRISAVAEITVMPDLKRDGTHVIRHVYKNNAGIAKVELYKIEGGGHTWPGKQIKLKRFGKSSLDISANDLMWAFFQKHQR